MDKKEWQKLWQRFGGHIILVAVALTLLLMGRTVAGSAAWESVEWAGPLLPVDGQAGSPDESFVETAGGEAGLETDITSLPVLTDASLAPVLNPVTFRGREPEHELQRYTVQAGDTPNRIAERFGIEPPTLLGGNPWLSQESSELRTGVELIILPIDGVLHDVQDGDTLEGLAQRYGVPAEDIIAYEPNNLEFPYRLYPNTQILVPGAVREVFVWTAPQPVQRPAGSTSALGRGAECIVSGTRTFLWPVTGRRITQYYWYGHRAIDVGLPEGTPVIASDTGVVTYAGWNAWGYGILIVINHCNGYETYYAHLSSVAVTPGQVVYQGSYIGASGNTGRSSGPHLHFEIRYNNNLLDPLQFLR